MGYRLVLIHGPNRLRLGVMFLMEARGTGCDCPGGAGGEGVNQRLTRMHHPHRPVVHATVGLRAACALRSARTPRIAWTSEQVGGDG
jgi:hypothetical protein